MIFYFAIAIAIFCCIPIEFSSRKFSLELNDSLNITKQGVVFIFTLMFVFFGGFRWLTGTDWVNYKNLFDDVASIKSLKYTGFEYGYALLNFVVKQIFDSYTVFLIVFYCLVIIPKVFIIKRLLLSVAFVFLYFCTYMGEMVAVRNALGVSILLCSIPAIHSRNKKQFLFLTLLATSVHYSCFAWIISYWLYHKRISKKHWLCFFIIAFALMFFGGFIYSSIINLIFKPFGNMGIIVSKILFYANDYIEPTNTVVKKIMSLVKRMVFLPLYFTIYNKLAKQSSYNRGILNLYLFGNLFSIAFMNSFQQLNRCVIANIFLEVILLPDLFMLIKSKSVKMLSIWILFLYGIEKLYFSIIPFKDVLVPFYLIFNYQNRTMY
ncbi:MAG: EpsG family protein [Treponemataceae bacterium]|nr:EpsG family protein [Treponemataceae bacterium]